MISSGGATVTVLMESSPGASPARTYSPLVAADVRLEAGARLEIPMARDFEHAVLVVSGGVEAEQTTVDRSTLLYLGGGREAVTVAARNEPSQVLLLGGEPFAEELVMWWNFVARSHDEIVAARAAWQAGERFGVVTGYDGDRLAAPELPTITLKPRPGRRPT